MLYKYRGSLHTRMRTHTPPDEQNQSSGTAELRTTEPGIGRFLMGIEDHPVGVHDLLDGLRKKHPFCWNQIVPVAVPTKHLNVAGTSPEQVIGTSPEQHGVCAAHLNIVFPKGC